MKRLSPYSFSNKMTLKMNLPGKSPSPEPKSLVSNVAAKDMKEEKE